MDSLSFTSKTFFMQANTFSDEDSRRHAATTSATEPSPGKDSGETENEADEDPVLDEEDLEENDLTEEEADEIEWEDEEENRKGGKNTGE